MGASILSVILGRVVFSTYPWPLGPVARPFGSAQHSETEFYRGFGESETTIFNDGLDLAVAESVLSACYNIASQLDEHVSGCWTGPYLGDGHLDRLFSPIFWPHNLDSGHPEVVQRTITLANNVNNRANVEGTRTARGTGDPNSSGQRVGVKGERKTPGPLVGRLAKDVLLQGRPRFFDDK